MRSIKVFVASLGLLAATVDAQAIEFIPLQYPGSTFTQPANISGNSIVGLYGVWPNFHGFLYDGINWTTIDYPGQTYPSTNITGVSGNKLVGQYSYGGFLYDGVTFTDLTLSNGTQLLPYDIVGDVIVGRYSEEVSHGFVIEAGVARTLDYPSAIETHTTIVGIAGPKKYLGNYWNAETSGFRNFMYDNGVFTTLPTPLPDTNVYHFGISDSTTVGRTTHLEEVRGFIYSGGAYTYIDAPDGSSLEFYGIDGNRVIGAYGGRIGMPSTHAFIAIIPEPSTFVLAMLGFVVLAARQRRRSARLRMQ